MKILIIVKLWKTTPNENSAYYFSQKKPAATIPMNLILLICCILL